MEFGNSTQQQQSCLLNLPDGILRLLLRQIGLLRPCPTSILKERGRLGRLRETGGFNRRCNKQPFIAMPQASLAHGYYRRGNRPLQPCGIECRLRHERFLPLDDNSCDVEAFGQISYEPWCEHPPFPLTVLLVCRRLNLEGTKILYGENTICLNTWDQHATDYFLRLRPETLAAIRNLHVFYSDTTWVRESPRKNSWDYAVYDYAYYDMLQTRWVQVCSTLQRAHRDSLTLTFESCAIDLNATQRMLGALSKIRVQHLRLSMGAYVRHSQGLTRTLHETVRQCTSSQPASTESPPDSSFPFERLPYELQMNVLSHTGLVITPHSLGMDRVDILWIRVEERPRPLIGGCCGTCNTSNFASCLCHSNYKETISTTCMCERLPDCLFRVSRNFGKMAHRTFYSLNQFYVTGELFEMLQHVENMPSRNLGLVKSFCVDLGIMPAEDCYEYIGKMNWVEELAVYDWNKPRNRKALKKLFKLLHKRGHSDLSIKITSRIQLMLILQHVVEPHDKPQLRIFCDWLARRKYPRVSVMARFSKNRGGFLRQDWDTLFLVSLIEGEETETDDGESWLDSRERLVRWYPYGAAWKDILVGAIYGPKVPLLNS